MKTAIAILALGCLLALTLSGCQNVYVTSAKVYLQQNDLENAKKQLQEGLAQNPNDAEAHYLLGEVYSREKKIPEMLQEFSASLAANQKHKAEIDKIEEQHYLDHYNGAVEYFNAQKYPESIANLKTAILIQPNAFESWSLLGKSYVNSKQYPEAEEALRKAVALDTQFENVSERALLMQVYYNAASSYNDQANREDDAMQKSDLRAKAGAKFQEALNSAEEILRQDAANKDATKIAAFCYSELTNQEPDPVKRAALQSRAIDYFQKVLETQPDNADMVFNLGLLYTKLERYDEALALYERVYQLNPQDAEALQSAAFICLDKKKDNPKAIELYKRALEINPENAANWMNLGIAQIQEGSATNNQNLIEDGKKSMEKGKSLGGQNP